MKKEEETTIAAVYDFLIATGFGAHGAAASIAHTADIIASMHGVSADSAREWAKTKLAEVGKDKDRP